jgi:hypothetical protein
MPTPSPICFAPTSETSIVAETDARVDQRMIPSPQVDDVPQMIASSADSLCELRAARSLPLPRPAAFLCAGARARG